MIIFYMLIKSLNYIMFIIVMVMSRDIVSYVICIFDVIWEITMTIQINKLIYFNYIDITISLYGIMCINNNIISKSIIRLLLDLKLC